jgi:hypothetical protein
MAYKDFTEPKWTVRTTEVPDLCAKASVVVITGPADDVKVECGAKPFLGPGSYQAGTPEQIVAKDENEKYTISLFVGKPNRLEAEFWNDRRIGGTWTADDGSPGPGAVA